MNKQKTKNSKFIVGWLTLVLVSYASAGVIGEDGRKPMQPGTFQAYAVGLLPNSGRSCTATLLSKRLAISNRHCFFDQKTNTINSALQNKIKIVKPNQGKFDRGKNLGPLLLVGMVEMQAMDVFEIRELWWGPTNKDEDDWAVLLLDKSAKDLDEISKGKLPIKAAKFPGEKFRTSDLAKPGWYHEGLLLDHAGYSESYYRTAGTGHVQHQCHALGFAGEILKHDCSNTVGASGGGLWLSGTHALVAINAHQACSEEYENSQEECGKHVLYNGAVTVDKIRGLLTDLISKGN